MAISAIVKNMRDGSILIEDGTGTPLNLTVQYEDGNFSISGLTADQKDLATYMDRGDLCSIRATTVTFPSVAFNAHLTDISDGTEETLPDFLVNKTNGASTCVSTLGAAADVYTVKMTWTIAEPGGGTHTVVCDDCRATLDMSEGDPSSFSISAQVLGSVTMT